MRDQNIHVLWIRQGLCFDPGKYPQLYTLHSDFTARSSPVVSSLSAEKLASLQFPPTGEPLGMCTPLKLSFPQLPAAYVTLILETHQGHSPASGPTPESPLGFLANSTLTLPPLPQAKEGFPLTSNHLLTSSAPFPPQICLPSQMAVAGLDQL